MAIASLLFFFVAFVVFNIITKHLLNKVRNHPPSPFLSLPIFGHLYLLRRPLYKTLTDLSRRHGPLFFLQLGTRQLLVVSSPSLAEDCLTKNDIVFANRPRLLVGKHLAYNYTTLIWASYGDHWRHLRKIASLEIFSTHRLQTLAAVRQEEVRSLIFNLFQNQNDRTAVTDMRNAFFELTFNIMMRMIAGKRYYGDKVSDVEEAKKFREIREATSRLGNESLFADFLPWIKSTKGIEKRMIELQKMRDGFLQLLVDEQRRKMTTEGEKKKNLIQVLLSLQEDEPEYYTDDMIKGLMIVRISYVSFFSYV